MVILFCQPFGSLLTFLGLVGKQARLLTQVVCLLQADAQ